MDTHQHAARKAAPFSVQALSSGALPETAALHQEFLPNGFFPALGQRFLRRWHKTFITSTYGIGLTACDSDGRCCGFLIGTTDQRGYTEDVLARETYRLAAAAVGSLAMRPRLAAHFVRTRGARYLDRIVAAPRRGGSPGQVKPSSEATVAVLHALVTEPASRGCGVGATLLQEFEKQLRQKGVRTLRLVTLASGGAAEFYSRLGYTESDRRTNRDGEEVVEFERRLGETT